MNQTVLLQFGRDDKILVDQLSQYVTLMSRFIIFYGYLFLRDLQTNIFLKRI
jgi:hypothetical protein